jgi:imidazolonepropionase-like amidohydrolase
VTDIMKDMDTDPLTVRKKFVQMELDMTLAMFRAGVPFMAGTDTAAGVHIFPGFSLHQELVLFQKAGLTPMQALQTATLNPARFIGRTAEMGTVERGKLADLVILDADPLKDIANTQKIRGVVLAGRYFDRAALDRMLRSVVTAAAAEPVPSAKPEH